MDQEKTSYQTTTKTIQGKQQCGKYHHEKPNLSEEDEVESQESQNQQSDDIRNMKDLHITDPHQYLNYCIGNKKIKVMDECNPIYDNIYLKDISLHKKGPLQDKIYSKNDKYYVNIRRGNTLCQIYDKKGIEEIEESELFMCRRGMKKFYDLQPEYLKVNRKLTHQHSRYRKRIFEQLDEIFDNPSNTNENGKNMNKIHLYGLFKQNGEHCQITYMRSGKKYFNKTTQSLQYLEFWLFASKNVAILARNQADLENYYEKQRFYWAKLIGKQFFIILSKFTEEQINSFKEQVIGKTLLGEHCGYQKHQHITKYQQIQIIFYGLVENNGFQHCLPVRQCEKFLKKYDLKMSKMTVCENLSEKNKVYQKMFQMLKNVAQGTMNEYGQGNVMYIVCENESGQQKTVGMCKLKTCEYLIFRKMREMIKIYFAKKGNTANNFEKYQFQIENLCESYFKPPKKLDFYYKIAEEAFRQVRKHQKSFSDDEFRYKFVSFLDKVMETVQNRQQQTKNNDSQEEILQSTDPRLNKILLVSLPLLSQQTKQLEGIIKKRQYAVDYAYRNMPTPMKPINKENKKKNFHLLHMVPRLNAQNLKDFEQQNQTTVIVYAQSQQYLEKVSKELQQAKNMKKSHLITFIKSEDKLKSLQLLNDKIKNFKKTCEESGFSCCKIVDNFNDITDIVKGKRSNSNLNKKSQEKKEIMQQQQQEEEPIDYTYIILPLLIPGSGKSTLASYLQCQYPQQSLTVISSDKIRQMIMQKQKNKRKDDVSLEQLFVNTKKKGLQKYREAITSAINERKSKIIFVDRVFCPPTIVEDLKQIQRPWTKFIILTQKPLKNTFLNDCYYPISMKFLLNCIKRTLQRQQHQTLSEKPTEIIRVLLKFYQMYRSFNYDNKLSKILDKQNITHEILHLQLIEEDEQDPINLHLKKKLQQILKFISPGNDAPTNIQQKYNELIEMIYKYSDYIDRCDKDFQHKEEGEVSKIEQIMKECSAKIFKVIDR